MTAPKLTKAQRQTLERAGRATIATYVFGSSEHRAAYALRDLGLVTISYNGAGLGSRVKLTDAGRAALKDGAK